MFRIAPLLHSSGSFMKYSQNCDGMLQASISDILARVSCDWEPGCLPSSVLPPGIHLHLAWLDYAGYLPGCGVCWSLVVFIQFCWFGEGPWPVDTFNVHFGDVVTIVPLHKSLWG